MPVKWEDVQQFIRKAADWAAGALVAWGGFDVAQGETISGILMGLASLIWWLIWNKWLKKPAASA
jgi:hypothetical protein